MTEDERGCRSARGWVIGVGHVPVHEARLRSIEEIEQLEADLAIRQRQAQAAQAAVAAALRDKHVADKRVEDAVAALRNARALAVYRLSSSSDLSRPPDVRGPEHDLDDTVVDDPEVRA